MRFPLLILGNILAIVLSSYYIDGVSVNGGLWGFVMVGLVFSIVNFFLKPVLKLILGPFVLLTFGIFLIVINMAVLWVTDILLSQLEISGLAALFLATLLIGAINFGVHVLVRK